MNSNSEEFIRRINKYNNNNHQNQNFNQGGRQRCRNNNNANSYQKAKEVKNENKLVPLKYETWKEKDPPTVELKYTLNNRIIKESMIIYEDRTQEEILKLVKEFQNLIEAYNLWHTNGTVAQSAAVIYADFQRCLKGNTREIWDVIVSNQPRTAVQSQVQMKKFIKKHIGQATLQNQVMFLEKTRKPENMSVLQWINQINNINACLPLMAENAVKLTEYELAMKVIARNIPPSWVCPFHMMKLYLKENVEDMLDELLIIEDQYTEPKTNHQKHVNGKPLKNSCRLHKGNHEWDNSRENPKNKRNSEQRGRDGNRDNRNNNGDNCNRQNENGNNTRRQNREEFRNTEGVNHGNNRNYIHDQNNGNNEEMNPISS